MKKKIASIGIGLLVLIGTVLLYQKRHESNILNQNIEALANGESELEEKCGGCSTDKEVYCCHLIIEGFGGFFLFKD